MPTVAEEAHQQIRKRGGRKLVKRSWPILEFPLEVEVRLMKVKVMLPMELILKVAVVAMMAQRKEMERKRQKRECA